MRTSDSHRDRPRLIASLAPSPREGGSDRAASRRTDAASGNDESDAGGQPAERHTSLPPGTAAGMLYQLLRPLPDTTLLPVAWILEQLTRQCAGATAAADDGDLLSAEAYGRHRRPPRSADWVRRQCAAGRLAGAFKDGGAWVIPAGAELPPSGEAPNDGGASIPTESPIRPVRRASEQRRTHRRW